MKRRPLILIISGSPQGQKGNSALLIKKIVSNNPSIKFQVLHLSQMQKTAAQVFQEICNADAVLMITGTYWDSWGSPLQKFLEELTPFEGHPSLLGKPAGIITLMHSVGGKEVLSRLQGVLSTFGFLIPPMSGMTYSLTSEIALQSRSTFNEDFWSLDDTKIILKNLLIASSHKSQWDSWPVDRKNPKRIWMGKA